MKSNILFIDNDESTFELAQSLESVGHHVVVSKTGADGIVQALKKTPSIIFLEIDLPDIEGIEVCESLRKNPALNKTFIIFLSVHNEDYTQVAGYRAGGDDYIIKPVRSRVLRHKIDALLERNNSVVNEKKHPTLVLDQDRFSILRSGNEIIIPKKEFELLSYLMSSPNKVFRRKDILINVWGDSEINGRTIDVHIRKLRERFGMGIINTIKGVGYRFMG